VSAPWVAADVRALAVAGHRAGHAGATAVARSTSLAAAITLLSEGAYATSFSGVREEELTLADLEHRVAASVLWNMRVLAGWSPPDGVAALRGLAGWFEIANIEALLRAPDGRSGDRLFDLGSLATDWRRLRDAQTPAQVRAALATPPWSVPAAENLRGVGTILRCRLLERALGAVAGAGAGVDWINGATALLCARETAAGARVPATATAIVQRIVGVSPDAAADLARYRTLLPRSARWVLDDIDDAADLWRGELAWWSRVERDAAVLVARRSVGAGPVVGAVGLLAADAWRVRGALELAARGGRGRKDFDVVD
jgi:hypothetical protein